MKPIFLSILLLIVLLTGCSASETANENPDIEGLIYTIGARSILVVEGIEDITIPQEEWQGKPAIQFTVTDQTVIADEAGNRKSFADLQAGMKVKVWSTGPIMESYPMQTTAKKILILID